MSNNTDRDLIRESGSCVGSKSNCSNMSGTQLLRLLLQERLTAAVEEIFVLVEKTISEYQV